MDVIEIDGASNRGIDEIRELRENVRYTPAKSHYKIYIIDEVHMLTREAFNALLKTLEEPPPHIVFVFATTEPHKIPATILSRCQRYDFKRIPLKEIMESMKKIISEEGVHISQRGLLYIARESEGSMRDAQSLLDQVISYAGKDIHDEQITEVLGLVDRKILFDTLEAIVQRDAARCMEVVEQIYQYGYDVQHFCRELLQQLRNLILLKITEHLEALMELPEEEIQALRNVGKGVHLDHLNNLFNLLLKGEEQVSQSTFPRTMLEMTLIRMATLHPGLPIDEILKKLEGMEKGEEPSISAMDRGDNRPNVSRPEKTRKPDAVEKIGAGTASAEPEKPPVTDNAKEQMESGGAPLNTLEETWKELVTFARTRNPVLGSFLVFGELTRLSDERIEIGFEKDSFHYERMLEEENREQLERICRDYLGREAKLIISPVDPEEGPRPRGRSGFLRDGVEKGTEKKAEEHPLIQEALRIFDGRIVGR